MNFASLGSNCFVHLLAKRALSKSMRSPFNACPAQDKLRCEIMTFLPHETYSWFHQKACDKSRKKVN